MFKPGYSAPSSSRRERGEEDLGLVEAVSGDLEGAESGSFVGEAAPSAAPPSTDELPKKQASPAPEKEVAEPKAEAKVPEASNV